MKIAVAGTGYVGLVTGVCLAHVGHIVTCVDIDENKVKLMESGICPIYEPDLNRLMLENQERIKYTTDYQEAYKDVDVIFIGVGTPERKDGSANLKYVYNVAEQIGKSVNRDCIVVLKSTVPIGTTDRVENIIKESLINDVSIEVAFNPEFLSQGTAVKDTLRASRIVLGVSSAYAEKVLREIYDSFDQSYVVTDRRSAEMIKYASNDFLALKISYINEIANLCEIVGANVDDVSKGMGLDPRIGNRFLMAGIGYGGSCFPKDTKALHWLASFHDYELKTVKAAIEVNENQKLKLIKKARRYYDNFSGLKIAILGLTFKPGTDDLREAPSIENIPVLLEDGAQIKAWDPVGINNYKKIYPNEIEYCQTIEDTLKDTDICFIFTEWKEIKLLTPNTFKQFMSNPLVIDGRNCYSPNMFRDSGVLYDSIGRVTVK